MARKAKQRIRYVLPLANQVGGHRLGVNGLAVDSERSILYSGGRDGVICAWDLNLDSSHPSAPERAAKVSSPSPSTCQQRVQAHTHWINDVALVQQDQALVSASSDITVKLWRPEAADGTPPQTIGLHSDYVKTLAVPSRSSDWIASGGLDRKIILWDLNGAGEKMGIDVGNDEATSMGSKEKGSVYALAATTNTIASGGPESTVRVWDTRSGRRITKLVGHTDNIRSILVSHDGTTVMTASSDRTVKVWSTLVGRCMFTLTMHDASVWSLFSAHPDLSVFYSSDRNGLIAKTDSRNQIELDEGLSVAVAQEHEGVHKVVAASDCLWTATSRPSINRWRDVNIDNASIEVPENYTTSHQGMQSTMTRYPSPPYREDSYSGLQDQGRVNRPQLKIPLKHVLRLSNKAYFPSPIVPDSDKRASITDRRGSKDALVPDTIAMQPVRSQPEASIEGQNGIIKHVMLNDRKRVLTLDMAGEVVMWDLLKCVPIKSFGKRHLEDVQDEITTTTTTVANWCTVDTRTGSVAVILEENTCFDAEMYADELDLDEKIEFREDQRINLGKWVLRYLFSELIAEEVRRDEAFRSNLLAGQEEKRLQRDIAPASIQLPQVELNGWNDRHAESPSTPKATNGTRPVTPGLGIGFATPGMSRMSSPAKIQSHRSSPQPTMPTPAEGASTELLNVTSSQPDASDRTSDYFSSPQNPSAGLTSPGGTEKTPTLSGEGQEEATTPLGDGSSKEQSQTPGGKFGKKFSMRGMSFSSMKKIGRTQTNENIPAAVEEKDEAESDSRSSKTSNSRVVDDNLLGTVQKMRFAYEDAVQHQIQSQQAHENGLPVPAIPQIAATSAINPSLPSETPVLKPPLNTTILIQEDRPEAGGVADLFEGTVGALGSMCDLVEKAAPMWLGEVLLRNQIPVKDIVKISFVLEPEPTSGLPSIAADGNNRLNANRMLRAKKILGYVAERIEPAPKEGESRPRPEEYLQLWCQNQLVSTSMTLATIRSHVWRGGSDIVLYYKSNGSRTIRHAATAQQSANIPLTPKPSSSVGAEPGTVAA